MLLLKGRQLRFSSRPRPRAADACLVLGIVAVPPGPHAEPAAVAAQLQDVMQVAWGKRADRDGEGKARLTSV